MRHGRRLLENIRVLQCSFIDELACEVRIGVVRHAETDAHGHVRMVVLPVDDHLGDEARVGHDHHGVVFGDYGRATRSDFRHVALDAAYFDAVANADRPFEHDDEPADPVADDVLQTEADAHADRAHQHVQRGQVDAERLHDDQEADQNQYVPEYRGDRLTYGQIQVVCMRENAVDHPALKPPGQVHQRDDQRDEQQQAP